MPAVKGLAFFGAMLIAAFAVFKRLDNTTWIYEERTRTSAVIAVAAFVPFLCAWTLNKNWGDSPQWDSIYLFFLVVFFVTLAAAGVLLLPQLLRRLVLSLVVLFHFMGIVSAVTSVPYPGTFAPWISVQLWSRVYRPYLYFMYLTNAYHFYSPDPGPATLEWYYIKFEDGTGEWYRLAEKSDFSTRQEYQRMLAITESTNYLVNPNFSNADWDAKVLARRTAGATNSTPIPISMQIPVVQQYREPNYVSKAMIKCYAQYVAEHYKNSKDPDLKIKSVKVYRVVHDIMPPARIAEGVNPWEPDTYLPYYMGEFTPEGKMLDPKSPYLYWLLHREPKLKPNTPLQYRQPGKRAPTEYLDFDDYCEIHALTTGPDPKDLSMKSDDD